MLGFGLVATVIGCTPEPEPMGPPDYGLLGIETSERSLGRRHDHPTESKPRDDLPARDVSLPVDWAADAFNDRNWQFQLHAWRPMDYALYEYRETADAQWHHRALAIALDWAHFHLEQGKESD